MNLSEVGRINHILLRRPQEAFINQETINAQWHKLTYKERPLYHEAVKEYDQFIDLLQSFGITTTFLPADNTLSLDSLYVRDAAIVSHNGVILCNMGKPQRVHEPAVAKAALLTEGIPVAGAITGEAKIEGGDVVWLDSNTVAVGRTYRTNDEGINQLQSLVDAVVIPVSLPHYRGPSDVFHLMSILSPLDDDLALVYSPLMPISFREYLLNRGIALIDVPDTEFETMGCNVLTVAPRQCIMLQGNPRTKALLEQAGIEVYEIEGREICVKGEGGPTCLTRPLLRE